MKITKSQLKQIIKEEIQAVLQEQGGKVYSIERAQVAARSGPGSYYDVIKTVGKNGILDWGTDVQYLETKGNWVKAMVQNQEAWLPRNAFVAVGPKKRHRTISRAEAGDISPSPAGLSAAAKG
mgnify:CR=1 FL=1